MIARSTADFASDYDDCGSYLVVRSADIAVWRTAVVPAAHQTSFQIKD
jgi:hypothetical protein